MHQKKRRFIGRLLALSIVCSIFASCIVPAAAETSLPFTDLGDYQDYIPYVEYLYEREIVNGTSETTFGPNQTIQRYQIALIFYRTQTENTSAIDKANIPASSFKDLDGVMPEAQDAIAWAEYFGLLTGRGDGVFDPYAPISRQEVVTFLYRYATNIYNLSHTQLRGDSYYESLTGFSHTYDENGKIIEEGVANWARLSMKWAIDCGIIDMIGGDLAPKVGAQRIHLAKMFYVLLVDWLSEPVLIPGSDSVHMLTIHNPDAETSPTGRFISAWAERVTKASDGRLQFEILNGGLFGSPRDMYDFIVNGTCDIGWGLISYFPGVFEASEAISLPMLPLPDADIASYVFWNLYDEYDFLKPEFEGIHTLLLHAGAQAPISTKTTQFTAVDQFIGWTIQTNSMPQALFIQNLGAAPVSVINEQLYRAIENNIVNAAVVNWETIKAYQLYEPLGYYLDANIGVSGYFFAMNEKIYNELPTDLQAIIDECSGAAALEYVGSFWNDATSSVLERIKTDGDVIYTLPDAEQAKLQAVADKTIADWIARVQDGDKIYQAILDLIDRYKEA